MRWAQLLPELALPSSVDGVLDWASGLVRLNRTWYEWDNLRRRPAGAQGVTAGDQALIQLLTHEVFHFLQITTTGYLYTFAVELFEIVRTCVHVPSTPEADVVVTVSADACEAMDRLFQRFDRKSSRGISARDIVESHAYFVEHRVHWQGLDPAGYEAVLSAAPAPEYRVAYDYAREILGNTAFHTFPLVASLALLSSEPAHTYTALVDSVAIKQLRYEAITDIPLFLACLKVTAGDTLVGTSAEVANTLPRHPIYFEMVRVLNEHCGGGFSVLEFMAGPHRLLDVLANDATRPLLLNPSPQYAWPMYLPDCLWSKVEQQERQTLAFVVVALAAASNRALTALLRGPSVRQ